MWMLNVLAVPSEAFSKIQNYSVLFVSYLIVSSGLVVGTLFYDMLNKEITGITIITAVFINYLLMPFIWMVYAFYLYICVYFSNGEKSSEYEKILSLVISVNIIIVVGNIFESLFVKADLLSNHSLINLQLLFNSQDEILALLFGKIELFTIWFLSTLVYGLSYITNISKRKSFIIVITGWLIATSFMIYMYLNYGGPGKGININIG